jgi:hypothetical protein
MTKIEKLSIQAIQDFTQWMSAPLLDNLMTSDDVHLTHSSREFLIVL